MITNLIQKFSKGLQYLSLPAVYPHRFSLIAKTLFTDRLLLHELARLTEQRRWFEKMGFKTIVDVGANTGAFSMAMRMILPDCQIYAFEPLPDVFEILKKNLLPLGRFSSYCSAIGDQNGQVNFFRSVQSASSSVLPMGELHSTTFPWTAELKKVSVPLARLDEYLPQMKINRPLLLKVDVQGYEDRVFLGAPDLLRMADFILTEVSYRPLYEGQALFADIHELLANAGYEFKGNFDNLLSPIDTSIIQSDALFMRKV